MAKRAIFRDSLSVQPVGIRAPEDSKAKAAFIDSYLGTGQALLVRSIAQHAGRITRNHGLYLPAKVETGRLSMLSKERGGTAGYDKPVLVNHIDGSGGMFVAPTEPRVLGRAVANRYVSYNNLPGKSADAFRSTLGVLNDIKTERNMYQYLDALDVLRKSGVLYERDWDGLGHLEVDAIITDHDAIAQILDRRMLTVSTGMTSPDAFCSECHVNWMSSDTCDHEPGVEGCFAIPGDLHYEEAYSYVANPGDGSAQTVAFQMTNDTNAGITNVMTESAREDHRSFPLTLSFTDAYRSSNSMSELLTTDASLEPTVPKVPVVKTDPVIEDGITPDVVVPEELVAPVELKLQDASVESLTTELIKHPVAEILDGLIPAFSDAESLKTIYCALDAAGGVPAPAALDTSAFVTVDSYNELKAHLDNAEYKLNDEVGSKKYLRIELAEAFNEKRTLLEERNESTSRLHDLLVEFTTVLRMIDSKEGDFETLKTEQSEKTVLDLESQFNDLRGRVDFDKMSLRPDGTSGAVSGEVVDPTLPGAGLESEVSVSDSVNKKEVRDYTMEVERYMRIRDFQSLNQANNWVEMMKSSNHLPRDFDITKHLAGGETND